MFNCFVNTVSKDDETMQRLEQIAQTSKWGLIGKIQQTIGMSHIEQEIEVKIEAIGGMIHMTILMIKVIDMQEMTLYRSWN